MFGPALFNQNAVEYLKTANENITVIVQIESRSGLENCEDIAKVPGIGLFEIPTAYQAPIADRRSRCIVYWT